MRAPRTIATGLAVACATLVIADEAVSLRNATAQERSSLIEAREQSGGLQAGLPAACAGKGWITHVSTVNPRYGRTTMNYAVRDRLGCQPGQGFTVWRRSGQSWTRVSAHPWTNDQALCRNVPAKVAVDLSRPRPGKAPLVACGRTTVPPTGLRISGPYVVRPGQTITLTARGLKRRQKVVFSADVSNSRVYNGRRLRTTRANAKGIARIRVRFPRTYQFCNASNQCQSYAWPKGSLIDLEVRTTGRSPKTARYKARLR